MKEWISRLPLVGKLVPSNSDNGRGAGASRNVPLVAERERSRQLERDLVETRQERDRLIQAYTEAANRLEHHERELSGLEKMLSDVERAHSAIVYYQLREVWSSCQGEIEQMTLELAQRMEEEERDHLLQGYKKRQETTVAELEEELRDAEERREAIMKERRGVDLELKRRNRFWHVLKRKQLEIRLQSLRKDIDPIEREVQDVRERLQAIRDREAPRFGGLSIEGRRRVNLAAIAMAQYLYLRLQHDSVADMARNVQKKVASEANFGPADECLKIVKQVREMMARWRADRERADKVRRRAVFLSDQVKYSAPESTVPDLSTVDHLYPAIGEEGGKPVAEGQAIPFNVLDADLWGIRRVML
jgi:chromosome segregation ATPase